MRASGELARRHGVRLHTHLAETRDEEAYCLSRFGKRPLDLLEEAGWMSGDTWLAHGIFFNSAEVARLGKAGRRDRTLSDIEHAVGVGMRAGACVEEGGLPGGSGRGWERIQR